MNPDENYPRRAATVARAGRIEIASLIAYVASTGASFVTDAAFTIDGGYLG